MVALTSFAFLVSSVQGQDSANIFALSKESTGTEFVVRKLASFDDLACKHPSDGDKTYFERLWYFHYLTAPVPKEVTEFLGVTDGEFTTWMLAPSAVLGAATSVLLVLKHFKVLVHQVITNFVAYVLVIVTSAANVYSPLQTQVEQYAKAKECPDITTYVTNHGMNNLETLVAIGLNIASIVLSVMNFNHGITYLVAVVGYGMAFWANRNVVKSWLCTVGEWQRKPIEWMHLQDTICSKSTAGS
jgi:hypothetical protein